MMRMIYRVKKIASGETFKYVEVEVSDGEELSVEQSIVVLLDKINSRLGDITQAIESK